MIVTAMPQMAAARILQGFGGTLMPQHQASTAPDRLSAADLLLIAPHRVKK